MKPPKEFKGISIRRVRKADAAVMHDAFSKKGFTDGLRYEGPWDLRMCEKDGEVANSLEDEGVAVVRTVEFEKRCAGRVWLRKRDGKWNAGYWTHPDFQGKGCASQGLRLLILESGIKQKIHASVHGWNMASSKVLKENGFRFVKAEERFLMFEF